MIRPKRKTQTLGYALLGIGLAVTGRKLLRRWNGFRFGGRTVLVTGGSRGLGLVIARQLAGQGARLAICARDVAELQRASEQLAKWNVEVLTIPCDVTQPEQVQQMVAQIESQWGGLDVVINNAGIIQSGPLRTMTGDDFDQAMKTHFYGPLYVNSAVLPMMRRQGAGRIVNVASIGGRISVPHMLPYSASKFALVGYSLGLRTELAKEGLIVTTICPGLLRTGSPRNALFKGRHREEYVWFKTSDSLPLLSIGAERAAAQIIDACRHGDAYVVIGTPAKLVEKIASLFPGFTSDALSLADRLLPSADGAGSRAHRGFASQSAWSESWLTSLTDQASARNNERAS